MEAMLHQRQAVPNAITALMVAWLGPSARRLLSMSQIVATQQRADSLEASHLFQAAAQSREGELGRLLPASAKRLLVPAGEDGLSLTMQSLPVGPTIKLACWALAGNADTIGAVSLLREVFRRDAATRAWLLDILGKTLFLELEKRLLLGGFTSQEAAALAHLREQYQKGLDHEPTDI